MAKWEAEMTIHIVTPTDAGPPKKRPRYTPQRVTVEASSAEEAKQLMRLEVAQSKFPPRAGDEIEIGNIRQVED